MEREVSKKMVGVIYRCLALLIMGGWSASTLGLSEVYYVHTDHLGTPQVMTDKDQEVVWKRSQAPFGETVGETGALEQPLKFPGQYQDRETGFSYNYFRDYDLSLGRYVQSDPVGILRDYSDPLLQVAIQLRLIKPEKLLGALNHIYGYVEQNPVKAIDPTGLACFDSACIHRARELSRTAETFAQGNKIRKVKQLCEKWGGRPKDWKKRKGWDSYGDEYHWYELKGKKYGMKRAGEPDPF